MAGSRFTGGWWIAAGGLALVVAMVIVALVREPVELDPASPEGTVQVYLQAIADEDYAAALAVVASEDGTTCDEVDLARNSPGEPFTAALTDSNTDSSTANVTVQLAFGPSSDPLDPVDGGYEVFFELESIDGRWMIVSDPWPYFTWSCDQ